jgi:hypothetical protein
LLGLVAAAPAACQVHDPEPSPTRESAPASAGIVPAAKRTSAPHVGTYPNGGALVVEPSTCSVTRVMDTVRWTRSVAPCDQSVEAVVALDSTAIVRTPEALLGLDPDGSELWRVPLADPPPPAPLAAPTVTRDSLAVIAMSPQLVVAFRKGREAWRVTLPASDALIAAPTGSPTEGVLLASARGVRALGADGSLRWSTAPPLAPK